MIKKILTAGIAAASIAASSQALADHPSFNFVDLGYIKADVSPVNADGIGIGASFEIDDTLFWEVGYADISTDGNNFFNSADIETYNIGIGARTALNAKTSLYGVASLVRGEGSSGSSNASDTGYGLEAGVRGYVSESIELEGGVTFVDIFDDSDTTAHVEGIFHINESFALTAGSTLESDNIYSIGARFHF